MADINVERKSRSIWPWVIGLLVLAILAWLLLSMLGNDDREVVEDPAVVTEPVTTEQPVGDDPVVVTEPTTAPAP